MANTFKIIAIKPLKLCAQEYLKVLQPQECYCFYNDYTIKTNSQSDMDDEISYEKSIPDEMFNVGDIGINICAIVGKNGSGKSSIVELLYIGIYNLSRYLGMIRKEPNGVGYGFVDDIRFDLYLEINQKFHKIRFDDRNFYHYSFNESGKGIEKKEEIKKKSFMNDFFYSLIVNYSLYGLNAREAGRWLKPLFHKNDAYQTPIVLNPFRDDGKIDINTENYLVRARILSIILQEKANRVPLSESFFGDKLPRKIHFKLDPNKFKHNGKNFTFAASNNYGHRILPKIFKIFFRDENFQLPNHEYVKFTIDYIVRKLISITSKYPHYQRFGQFYRKGKTELLEIYLEKLRDDSSNISLKLKQAIYFLSNIYIPFLDNVEFTIEEIMNHILNTKPHRRSSFALEKMPPSFFKTELEFSNRLDTLEKFSSGEKQKIYSAASLVYHLQNLDSIHGIPEDNEPKAPVMVKYSIVNIVFDEIELYFHPDFQRMFVYNVKEAIKRANLKFINAINIIFITHSPFILSDIPSKNVMYLKVDQGKSFAQQNTQQTFGGNIHDLLASSFFLKEDGYMGEFAKQTINSAIQYLQPEDEVKDTPQNVSRKKSSIENSWTKDKISMLIESIGEPIIKQGMQELFNLKFRSLDEIEMQIQELQKQKSQLINNSK